MYAKNEKGCLTKLDDVFGTLRSLIHMNIRKWYNRPSCECGTNKKTEQNCKRQCAKSICKRKYEKLLIKAKSWNSMDEANKNDVSYTSHFL